jgi:hypothetical protein
MWLWILAHVLEILILLATAVEATALVYIYMLEKRQFEFQKGQYRIDLRVDIDFPEGQTEGFPSLWIENADAGSGFIESAELIAKDIRTQRTWEWKPKMAGKRKLPGFESVRVNLASALQSIGKDAWEATRSKVEVELRASVLVLVERRDQVRGYSTTYRTFITCESGSLSELIPVPLSALKPG